MIPWSQMSADENADGEGAAAEPEGVDAVTRLVVLAGEAVQPQDIAGQAHAERAAEEGERLEGRGAYAVVIARDLCGGSSRSSDS